jgi:hypothetical protein
LRACIHRDECACVVSVSDIFLSLQPCAKPLVLLVATLLLIIALGGLALYCLIVFGQCCGFWTQAGSSFN